MKFSATRIRPGVVLAALLFAVTSLGAVPAEAQTFHLFPCKIVCGYQLGNVRLLNDTSPLNQPYEDLKPGNYATTCNMFNYDLDAATQPVFAYVAIEGAGLIFLGQLNVAAFTANAFGCVDLINSLPPPPPNGTAFEGYLTFFTLDPDFHFDAVYTYESQNAFERHVFWFYDSWGPFGIAFQTLGLVLKNMTNPLSPVPTGSVLPSQFATASGAGGLGLGASIDVEEIDRIDINLTADTEDRAPAEVLDAARQTTPLQ